MLGQNNPKKNVEEIFDQLLENIQPVNFREYANFKNEKTALHRKHYLVSVVELLIFKANENQFSLCRKNEMVYLYNGQYWEPIDNSQFKDFLSRVALKAAVDKFDAKHHAFKDDLLKQFISDAGLKEIPVDNQTTLINTLNGTYEINGKNQFLRPFSKLDFLTYQLPFEYNKNAEAPMFAKFLNEVLPEKELQDVLLEFLGYIFIKNSVLKLEKVLLLYGSGANGKSVLFEVISALLGRQNITNYSLQSLTSKDGYYRAMIANKLLNYASEINGSLEASTFKQLASGEPVEARLPYGNPQIITEYARFVFNCNELPKEAENTHAFYRRLIILPFLKTIEPDNQDKKLASKIIATELSGVFNYLIQGLQRLLDQKDFTHSDLVQNEISQYEIDTDTVLMFLQDEGYEKSLTNPIQVSTLYFAYRKYCLDNGISPNSLKSFSQKLIKKKFIKKRIRAGFCFLIEKKFSSEAAQHAQPTLVL